MANSFDFGANWQDFSQTVLNSTRLIEATNSLKSLLGDDYLKDKDFIDIGSGTGLFSLAAKNCGVKSALGLDINPTCIAVGNQNAQTLGFGNQIQFAQLDILDSTKVSAVEPVDVVYAWGSLHHTGNLAIALQNASTLVRVGGTFVVAIYHKHWSSPLWKIIKRTYVSVPRFAQKTLIAVMIPIIAAAKFLVTGKNPYKKERGMDFRIDVIDWVGGYPYEYASAPDMQQKLKALGFSVKKTIMPSAPTGCVEYVCVKEA